MEDVTPEDDDIEKGIRAIADAFASIADSAAKAYDAIQKLKEGALHGEEDFETWLRRFHDDIHGPDSDDNPQ